MFCNLEVSVLFLQLLAAVHCRDLDFWALDLQILNMPGSVSFKFIFFFYLLALVCIFSEFFLYSFFFSVILRSLLAGEFSLLVFVLLPLLQLNQGTGILRWAGLLETLFKGTKILSWLFVQNCIAQFIVLLIFGILFY